MVTVVLLGQAVGVHQVLRATAGALENDQFFTADELDSNSSTYQRNPVVPRPSEITARDSLHEVDPRRRMTHPDDVERSRRFKCVDGGGRCTETYERRACARDVVGCVPDPQTGVLGKSRVTMQCQRLAPDQQVFNVVRGELRQQIDQVGGEVHWGARNSRLAGPSPRRRRGAALGWPTASSRGQG